MIALRGKTTVTQDELDFEVWLGKPEVLELAGEVVHEDVNKPEQIGDSLRKLLWMAFNRGLCCYLVDNLE